MVFFKRGLTTGESLSGRTVAVHRDMVPGREGKKVVPEDTVLASGEPESGQVALFNPA